MNLLAVDTTGEPLSLAVRAGEKVYAFHRTLKAPHDETLLPQIDRLLKRADLELRDLDAIAAASGPGRFTGIRIGMAYAAVAAGALKIPALAVSRLEAAAGKIEGKLICAVVPGWREEKFYQVFRGASSVGPAVWADPKLWHERENDLRKRHAVIAECDPTAEDLLAPAARHLARKRRPVFAPLYLKPAGYEAKRPSR
ncbi:MAG: tRNA (adenosine(37)-N6)-threonylcarbamoyltransferase complex dimerization subunit type 1 TsaB [Elusimicrobia bacterium]|nr:tRNA (adenosine(37)-N6)-threonylcarbamoyltransferase complex dimerization subunit type 1 TsaB [Elusimicrobiota bacterium]